MTPKEKAEYLIKYYILKDVALYKTDKFLEMLLNSKNNYKNSINYWKEVRYEIEQL